MPYRSFSLIGFWLLFASACATSQPEATNTAVTAQSGTNVQREEPANIPVDYVLGQGDRIGIQVFDEPDLTMEALVGANGIINYSYLGDIRVADKSPETLEKEITQALSDGYLVNPSVNVTVVSYRPFFINGEVRSPGSYSYQPGLTLDRAIALAGGLTDRASARNMFVQKPSNNGDEKRAQMQTKIAPGDIITIREGFF